MLAWDATARAEMLDARTAEFAANPIFGVQASLGVHIPKLAVPDADVAEAMVGKFERHRGATSTTSPTGTARASRPAAPRPTSRSRQTVDQLDAWLATPIDEDPLLDRRRTRRPASTRPAGTSGCCAVVQKQVRPAAERYRDVLRDEVAPQARPDERCGLT